MSRIKLVAVLAASILVTAVVALGWQHVTETSAHGVVDQQNQTGNAVSQINASEPFGQEFTPTMTTIVAADVRLETFNQAGAADITLRVRGPTISSLILASVTLSVPQNLTAGGEWVHFDLPSVVHLTPGLKYVIELETTNVTHAWHYQTPGSYAGGSGIGGGIVNSGIDTLFRTYGLPVSVSGDVDCIGAVNSIDALKILRYNASLSVSQTEPCVDIGQPIP